MILGTIRRILKEDLSKKGKLPDWIDELLSPLNEFIDNLTSALTNNLTFADNFSCTQTTIELTHGVFKEVTPKGKSKVLGVLVLSSGTEIVDKFGWSYKNNGNIQVKISYDGASAGTKAKVGLVILYS